MTHETFLQRRHRKDLQVDGRKRRIPNHQGKANEAHNEISPHSSKSGSDEQTKDNRSWRCGGKGTRAHCGWASNLAQSPRTTVWNSRFLRERVPQKIKKRSVTQSRTPTTGVCPEEGKEMAMLKRHLHSRAPQSTIHMPKG